MDSIFRMTMNRTSAGSEAILPVSVKMTEEVIGFHSGIKGYEATPLISLGALAKSAGLRRLYVKDESRRFGLNAFKGLGGSYAIAKYLCERFGLVPDRDTFRLLTSPAYAEKLEGMTFATATDGNHGRGVAWFSSLLGCEAYVYLPAGSEQERVENIRALGAHAEVTDMNYDDTVRFVRGKAKENGWVLVQDTSWDGYEEIPLNVMRGYTTLGREIDDKLRETGEPLPTHLFLQAGVGSMAGAVAGYLTDLWKENCPKIIVVEPDKADCLYRTAKAADGKLHGVSGTMNSMMAGLCCGEPCPPAWDILKDTACAFIACDDSYSAFAMKRLAKPLDGDEPIVSGESGAVTAGVAVKLMTDPALAEYKAALGMDENSRVLVISTEGDTCKENYTRIVNA